MADTSEAAAPVEPPFCDADTVPAELAASLRLWAARVVEKPATDKLHESVQLKMDPSLGLHAVARCDIRSGDLILSERALINIPDLDAQKRSMLQRNFGDRAPFFAPALAVDWHAVEEGARQAALELLWCHPIMKSQSNPMVSQSIEACKHLCEWSESLRSKWSPVDLMRFLHIVDLNIHRDDEDANNAPFTGIFVVGSKFSHSCAPNSAWSFSRTGCLQYHAIRPIAKGELFTFSYIGNGMNLVMSTMERRQRLLSLWFVCQCGRCTGQDTARRMRCPSCGACQCMPLMEETPDTSNIDWVSRRALTDIVPESNEWQCAACNKRHTPADLPLQAERELSRAVPEVMQGPMSAAASDAAKLLQLRDRASTSVGESHWTWMLATFAWLQKCFVQLRTEPIIYFSEADLKDASCAIAAWFRASAPRNSEQRMSALFIAVRLAHNLGGSLEEWGYDLAEDLGGGVEVTRRLEAHGWRFQDGCVVGQDEPPRDRHQQREAGRKPMLPIAEEEPANPYSSANQQASSNPYSSSGATGGSHNPYSSAAVGVNQGVPAYTRVLDPIDKGVLHNEPWQRRQLSWACA